MRILQLHPHLSTEEISKKLNSCSNIHHRSYWQILLSVSNNPNQKAEDYSKFLGVSISKVYRTVELFNKNGAEFTNLLKWGGRRNETSHLTLEQESEMMKGIQEKAINGEILTFKDVQCLIEEKLSKKVSDDYVWDLFKRHNWKKKAPRPQHPKHHQEAQDEFKKNFPKFWSPT